MSLTNNEIKTLRFLQQKKYRDQSGIFVVEGPKLVGELLKQERFIVDEIFHTEEWNEECSGIECKQIDKKTLERISSFQSPNQVLATVHIPELKQEVAKGAVTLILDDISDPGNLGTILRTADWFGIEQVILSPRSVELFNPKVIQASMGAIFRVHCWTEPSSDAIARLQSENVKVFAADMEGESIFDFHRPEKTALIIGNEAHGVNPNLINQADGCLTIPRKGETESLNAAVATAILCAEIAGRS